ncbi:hypothetical protein ACQP1K_28960 (plasmid) [Sphaerimonospora sp. CA-214678]|uniref:hypothetical protein n=1 Tax=Sphaerimonospora sp. CA-214678 TaxID=3240029 RepID=UPI003D90CD84
MSSMSSESSTEAALPKGWQAFVKEPNETTAEAVAEALEKEMSPTEALASVNLIAETLAKRSARERSSMSRLIASRLHGEVARGFLKKTAEVRLTHSTLETPKEQAVPQHDDVSHRLDLLPPKKLEKLPEKTPGGRDRQKLEALNLVTTDKVTVDLAELEQRTDDVRDASSIGHLLEALKLVNSIGGSRLPYSKNRRIELSKTVKGTTQEHLVEQIGFRAARTQRNDKGGLSAQNQLAVTYWRTNFRQAMRSFLDKLQVGGKPGPGDILVNSPRVLRKLGMVVSTEALAGLTIRPLVGKSGISVLSGTDKPSGVDWEHILRDLGATPSAYQLYELMDVGKNPPPKDFTVDTQADLAQLITCSPFSRLQEIARGKGELAPVCAMIEHLVLGLTDKLGPKRFDALTANALVSLSRLLDIVVENEENPSVAMRAVDLMMDEIGIVVAAGKYYTWTDYRRTMREVLLERAPSIARLVDERIQLDSHLMTSGMDALGTALYIALSSRGHGQVSRSTEEIDYYETALLLGKLKKGETVTPHKDVLIAALNPSTPYIAPAEDKLVAGVLEGLKTRKTDDAPFALILDTTIEIAPRPGGKTQLEVVLDGLKGAIADGSLEVFLCKSFQKYASFGTGKVAAGDLTMLSMKDNPKSAFARAEALLQDLALDLARYDEAQLVVHMLKHGHRDELELVRSAARNAKFVDEFCWPIARSDLKQGAPYVDGIPLLLRSTPTGDVDELFNQLVTIDQRDSFSFLRTSYVGGIPSVGGTSGQYVRINPGHESKETMVECFYAFGHLATSTPPGAKEPSKTPVDLAALTVDPVKEHLQALALVPNDDPRIARYRNSIVASYCAFAIQNVEAKATVMPLLIDFFGKPAGRVTIETQCYLADALLTYMRDESPGSDRSTLAALCGAAVVLPAWRLKPIARGLKLGGIGDSEEAIRLRKIIEKVKQ